MYGYQDTRDRDTTKAFSILAGLILVGAIAAGVFLGDSELLNPSLHAAKVDRLNAETEELRAQTAYEQRQREIELRSKEEQAAAELQALRDRRTRESTLLEWAGIGGIIVCCVAAVALIVALSYYFIERIRALQKGQAVAEMEQSDERTSPSTSESNQEATSERVKSVAAIQASDISQSSISYDGFLDFCVDFVVSNGRQASPQDHTQPDSRRRYYPQGISDDVAQTYISILCRTRIIVAGTNGYSDKILRQRIGTLDDIRFRITREAFERVIRENDVGHSSEQIITFPETRRGKGPRSAA